MKLEAQWTGFNGRVGPRAFDSIAEVGRLFTEISSAALSWQQILRAAPKGDRHPVLVLPGFTTSDDSTLILRRFLTQLGYKSMPWLLGTNTGNPKLLERAMRRTFRLSHSFGVPISIIGHSLGGVFAREIARELPQEVRSVITLGSPFAATDSESSNPLVGKLFERMSGLTIEEMREQIPIERRNESLQMPATAVFTKEDGVVGWQTCVAEETHNSENIRVRGSHCGLAMNPNVLAIIADRLAQDPNNWQRFDTEAGCRKMRYPNY